jgi:hypothetical protein
MKDSIACVLLALCSVPGAMAQTVATATPAPATAVAKAAAAPAPVARKLVEIYRIAPGQHAAFLEFIARCDEANRRAGLPARELYVHSDGAGWDFMLIQPASTPDVNRAALDAAWDELGLPSGADFFLQYRQFIAEHEDTFVRGPTTAADYLATRGR